MPEKVTLALIGYMHGFGGAEKSLVMLANEMVKRGYNIHLISLSANNLCYDIEPSIKYTFIPDIKGNKLKVIFNRYKDLRRILNDIKPQLVINFWFQSAYMTAVMKSELNFKILYSERGDPSDKEYSGLMGLVRSIILPKIDGFVFQSKGAQEYFSKKIIDRSCVIHNPVFIKPMDYPAPKERRKVIVNVGRLHEQKNQKLLINAFSKINNKFSDYTLEIYGDGELREELESQINKSNLSNKVQLKGTTKKNT